ncbi:MAG: 3-methyl-2-oxobutanoate hydroxymethyltransferase [Omnitrophica WOR_2 bacterium GWF2_38_59]|nr:MAG: 3-methyl-2-oxobutanoate hydroxymethyltransferase [Omnitrophica WOR_2 bacterium GWF2_38_59]OGX51082.1 MAG: 3-methyl-2-oxobutanoate hydroxymethyltransferase [Omnitrophica WOR_2 bacterium RIFOXYA2_FULL_38_17]OGX54129.1 MAG: 3-methyl-2-oxobutanoate hydroxymethyltransferase [Omnitrophica WOR_2 bacterium RIFOXYA12_FULL_38_10]OGX56158.1 MAG: 3-methyl-2-oxobutanoate hydroxymethyltransferase [Omnitrophica WOR_2 bacterium RIFOXYC2_FULL_38_12]OGX60406.1 MAG: 3-methyl-2-oxobutanoate hydroxymethyltr
MNQRITVQEIIAKKKSGEKITVLTAYDYSGALLIDKAGIDIVLVGDSLANVVLGLDSTLEVGMAEMIHHAKAVNRGVKRALVVGDMPYEAYQIDVFKAVENAKRFVDEAGCDAIKLEWFDQCLEVAEMVVAQGIPVMGHVGLTPQTAEKLGGFKVQGKDAESAKKIIDNAKALEAKGCFCVVLECVPFALAEIITKELSIPTIGIGAGVYCDGQVLVTNDLLGLFDRYVPKFVKKYADLSEATLKAITQFRDEVKARKFPDVEHSYSMSIDEINRIKEA